MTIIGNPENLPPEKQAKYVEELLKEVGEEQKLEQLERERGQGMSWEERRLH